MVEYTFQCARCGEINYEEIEQETIDKIKGQPLDFVCVCCWSELMSDVDYREQFDVYKKYSPEYIKGQEAYYAEMMEKVARDLKDSRQ